MLITSNDILATIQKMVMAGKQLPQMDRIKYSKNPTEERQKVLVETANLWWNLFGKRKIGVERWEKATEKALMISGIPKLETQIINPALMSVALQKCEEEYTQEQIAENAKCKKENVLDYEPANFPEICKLIVWHLKNHKRPLLNLPSREEVKAWAKGRISDENLERNMLQFRVYLCYCRHSERDGTKMPLKLSLRDNGYMHIDIVEKVS